MSFTKIVAGDLTNKGVRGLPDTPNLSTTDMQDKFEEVSVDVIIPKHNGLIDELEADTAAASLGAVDSNGDPTTIQAQLVAIQSGGYTKPEADAKFLTQLDAASTYLTQSDASSTYLTQSDASSTYLTQSDAASTYVAQVSGKDLSSNDYTDAEKAKLAGIEAGANNYVLPKGTQLAIGGVMGDGTTFTIDTNGVGHAVGGGGGTSDYDALINHPEINGVELIGDKPTSDFGFEAEDIVYDNSVSGMTATDVQAAIDELAAIDYDAEDIDYDNTTSGLTATDVQAAIDEVEGRVDTAESDIDDLEEPVFTEAVTKINVASGDSYTTLWGKVKKWFSDIATHDSASIGRIEAFMRTTAPTGYLACDGTAYLITDYPLLSALFLAEFGAYDYFGGNGTTTFAVPDLRGEFLRGTGTNSHSNAGSGTTVGKHQNPTFHPAFGINTQSSKTMWTYTDGVTPNQTNGIFTIYADSMINSSSTSGKGLQMANNTFATEWNSTNKYANYTSRPTSTSVLYCIRAY